MDEDDDIKQALENVILYKLDAEKGEGVTLSKEYEIKGYPTYITLNRGGNVFDRWSGYSKDYFIETMSGALQDQTPISKKMARFETDPVFNDALVLARYSNSLDEYANAVEYYRAAQRLNENPEKDYLYDIFSNTVDGVRKDMFTIEEAVDAANAALASAHADKEDKYGIARRMTALAEKEDKLQLAAPYLKAGIAALKDSDDPEDMRGYASLMSDYNLYIAKDSTAAVNFKKQTMPEGWMEDAGDLNSFSWWCFENNVNLEEAEELSRKSVKLAEPGKAKAMNLDTLAEICNARGKPYEAIEFTKIAVKEAPDDEYYKKQLARFEKLVSADN